MIKFLKKLLVLLVIVLVVLFLLVPVSRPIEFYCYKEGQPHTDIGLPTFPRWRLLLYKIIGFETYCKAKDECPNLDASVCDTKLYCKKVYNSGSVCGPKGDCTASGSGKKIPFCISIF